MKSKKIKYTGSTYVDSLKKVRNTWSRPPATIVAKNKKKEIPRKGKYKTFD